MDYSIWSHGKLLGETTLDFWRTDDRFPVGWFFPTLAGKRLLPILSTGAHCVRAWMERHHRDADGNPTIMPEMFASREFADIAETVQASLPYALELRREDGTVIPTRCITFFDGDKSVAEWMQRVNNGEDCSLYGKSTRIDEVDDGVYDLDAAIDEAFADVECDDEESWRGDDADEEIPEDPDFARRPRMQYRERYRVLIELEDPGSAPSETRTYT